ncbi:MAG TPA: mobile mystery protein A [Allosphingosinicella sp.]
MNTKALARKHLERRFTPIRAIADFERPPRGWVRAVRDALGLTTRQLGARLGRAHSNVTVLEKNEANDAITLKLLREAAAAMDCTLVYALVPNRPLDEILRERAARVAERLLAPISHSMALENQGLDRAALAAERERLVDELLAGDPRRLWDES